MDDWTPSGGLPLDVHTHADDCAPGSPWSPVCAGYRVQGAGYRLAVVARVCRSSRHHGRPVLPGLVKSRQVSSDLVESRQVSSSSLVVKSRRQVSPSGLVIKPRRQVSPSSLVVKPRLGPVRCARSLRGGHARRRQPSRRCRSPPSSPPPSPCSRGVDRARRRS